MNAELRERVLDRLRTVIDPETGADVVRMRLIQELTIGAGGIARYTFCPSSPLCPLAASPLPGSVASSRPALFPLPDQLLQPVGKSRALVGYRADAGAVAANRRIQHATFGLSPA